MPLTGAAVACAWLLVLRFWLFRVNPTAPKLVAAHGLLGWAGWLTDRRVPLTRSIAVRTSVTLQCLHHMAVRVRGLSGHSMVARGHAAQVMVWALVLAVGSSWCNSCLCVLGDGRQLGHQCALRRTERDWRC